MKVRDERLTFKEAESGIEKYGTRKIKEQGNKEDEDSVRKIRNR